MDLDKYEALLDRCLRYSRQREVGLFSWHAGMRALTNELATMLKAAGGVAKEPTP